MTSNKFSFFTFLFFLSFQSNFYSEEVDEIVVSGDWRKLPKQKKIQA